MSVRPKKPVYGLDFGTTNSTVGAGGTEGIKILPIDPKAKNNFTLRSIIHIDPTFENLSFGEEAISSYIKSIAEHKGAEKKTIFTGKKIQIDKPITGTGGWAGTMMVDEKFEVDMAEGGRLMQSLKSALALSYLSEFLVFDRKFSIEKILSFILGDIKDRSDKLVQAEVRNVVIGTPVNFVGDNNELARKRLHSSAKMAGFKNIEFEYEPIGAAWSYIHDNPSTEAIAFIFDFGGGTLDLSVVKFPQKKILANHGVPIGGDLLNSDIFYAKLFSHFGGDATFGEHNITLPRHLINSLKAWYNISQLKTQETLAAITDLKYRSSDKKALSNLYELINRNLGFALYEAIDKAKIELSSKQESNIKFDSEQINIKEVLTKTQFEHIIAHELKEVRKAIKTTLALAEVKPSDINLVVTTGGSSLIPAVINTLESVLGKNKIVAQDPFTSVASGLTLRAQEVF